MVGAFAGAPPHLHHAAGRELIMPLTPEQRRRNRKTALILVAIVIAILVWSFWKVTV